MNSYSYVRNNPINLTDPSGKTIWDAILGGVNAFVTNFAFGVGRQDYSNYGGDQRDFATGQMIGDALAVGVGAVVAYGGATAIGAGTGALAVGTAGAGVVAIPAGAAAASATFAYGASVAATAGFNLSQGSAQYKEGASGGDTAGKRFSEKTRQAAYEEADGKCVFCGTETTSEPGPLQTNTDHAIPRYRGGNSTLENAQNTCRGCNLEKGRSTTSEFI